MIRNAIGFAVRKHKGQVRKGNRESYINHPARVASRLLIVNPYVPDEVLAAAWLHDTLEDTDTIYDELLQFGSLVADLVQGMTNPSHDTEHRGKPRAERKRIDREHIALQDPYVKMIKLADRIDNLWDFYIAGDGFMYIYAEETQLLLDESLTGVNRIHEKELKVLINRILS